MLKVFLVEDEFVVREGIKRTIDWEKEGYEFVGEASDGELAYPMIQKEKPDIVITDIRMPFMDGLELSRLIKQKLPDTEIIILTGHEEFEYAKEGIKIGVAEYLSKPISGEKLLEAVRGVGLRIEEKQKEQEVLEQYRKEMEEDIEGEKRQLFMDLVNASKTLPELLAVSQNLNLNLSAIWYNIVLIKSAIDRHFQAEYSNRLVNIRKEMKQLCDEMQLLLFDRNLEGQAIVFMADTKEEILQQQERFFEQTEQIMHSYKNINYFIGVGEPVNRLREIGTSYDQASHAFAHRFLKHNKSVMYYKDIETEEENDNAFSMNHLNPKQFDRGRMQEFLRTGEEDEIVYFVEEFFRDLGTSIVESKMFRQYIAMDSFFCVTEFMDEIHQKKDDIEQLEPSAGIMMTVESTKQYFIRIITSALLKRELACSNRYGDVVHEALKYIEENYSDEELSLNMLASHVNFSPNHLSMIFSQQTGQTFIKYLTDYRMNRAKELLKCTGKKTNVIALEVGYKDSHYFSYLFRKTQGVTPTQYRTNSTSFTAK